MKYHFIVQNEKNGYWATCVELEGCVTQADTKKELVEHMAEALDVYLDEPLHSQVIFPLPLLQGNNASWVSVPVSPQIAFAFLLRRERVLHQLTQRDVASLLSMRNLYSYQRLERSRSANPTLQTIAMILKVFPTFPVEHVWR